MKIKRFNESTEFEDIEDTLLDIYDLLGEPNKSEYSVGNKIAYTLSWNLGFTISEYNGSKELDLITEVFDVLKTIKSSQSRVLDYDVEFKLTSCSLIVRLTPHSDEVSSSYKFFIKQNWRSVIFSYGEIAKFLKDRGYRIKNTDAEEYNSGDNSSVSISTDAPGEVMVELANMIYNELEALDNDTYDRPVFVTGGNGNLSITPEEEKCYAELDRYN
jgi:hypothetical protein